VTECRAFGRLGSIGEIDCIAAGIAGGEGGGGYATTAAAVFVAALVGSDPKEPALEIAFFESVETAESGKECLLGGVFGRLGLAEHAATEAIDMGLVTVDKAVEGIKAAVLCQ